MNYWKMVPGKIMASELLKKLNAWTYRLLLTIQGTTSNIGVEAALCHGPLKLTRLGVILLVDRMLQITMNKCLGSETDCKTFHFRVK